MTSWSRCPAAPMLSRGRAPTRTRPPGVLVCLHLGLSASTGTPNADPDHKYLPPARPTHTPPPHQARRPSHSSPALLSGTPLRVCAGVRERGRACSRPCNALAMERSGDPTYWPHRRPRTPRQAADTHTATSQAAGRATPVWVWGRESGRVGYLLLNVCAI